MAQDPPTTATTPAKPKPITTTTSGCPDILQNNIWMTAGAVAIYSTSVLWLKFRNLMAKAE